VPDGVAVVLSIEPPMVLRDFPSGSDEQTGQWRW